MSNSKQKHITFRISTRDYDEICDHIAWKQLESGNPGFPRENVSGVIREFIRIGLNSADKRGEML